MVQAMDQKGFGNCTMLVNVSSLPERNQREFYCKDESRVSCQFGFTLETLLFVSTNKSSELQSQGL